MQVLEHTSLMYQCNVQLCLSPSFPFDFAHVLHPNQYTVFAICTHFAFKSIRTTENSTVSKDISACFNLLSPLFQVLKCVELCGKHFREIYQRRILWNKVWEKSLNLSKLLKLCLGETHFVLSNKSGESYTVICTRDINHPSNHSMQFFLSTYIYGDKISWWKVLFIHTEFHIE